MISAAKLIYKVMAVVVLVIMLTLGTVYIYKATMGFTSVKYALLIWVIYSISAFFVDILYLLYVFVDGERVDNGVEESYVRLRGSHVFY